jgi:cytochrome P450
MLKIAKASLYDPHRLVFQILTGRTTPPEFFTTLTAPHPDVDMVSYRLCNAKGHILLSPEAIKDLFIYKSSQFERPVNARRAIEFFHRPNVFSSLGSTWQQQRQSIVPHIKKTGITCPQSAIQNSIDEDFAHWGAPQGINLSDELGCMTLRVFCNTMLSSDLDRDTAKDMARDMIHFQKNIYFRGMFHAVTTKIKAPTLCQKFKQAHDNVTQIMDDIISERSKIWSDRPADMLTTHMERLDYQSSATVEKHLQLREEMFVLMFAGHETLKTSLFWAIYHLSRHPEVYKALQEDAAKGAPTNTPPDQKPAFTLAQKSLMEAMRLNPPNFAIFRVANQDTDICGTPIKKGEYASIPYSLLHRRPEYWQDPEGFNPEENFSTANIKARPREIYGPFAHGPRGCPGKGMALQEGRMVLSTLATKFNITEPAEKTEPAYLGLAVTDESTTIKLAARGTDKPQHPALS